MTDYIERSKVIEAVEGERLNDDAGSQEDLAYMGALECAIAAINAIPDAPMGDVELQRFGIKWQGPQHPICAPMSDGYWTPWHFAATTLIAMQAEIAELRGM